MKKLFYFLHKDTDIVIPLERLSFLVSLEEETFEAHK